MAVQEASNTIQCTPETLLAFSEIAPPRSDSAILQSVKDFLKQSGLVDSVDDDNISRFCAEVECHVLQPGAVICVQGRTSGCSYMLLQGKVGAFGCFESSSMKLLEDMEASNKMIGNLSGAALCNFLGTKLRTFTAPSNFIPGISSGKKRAYSCVAVNQCILLIISNELYKECLESSFASSSKAHSQKLALLRSLKVCQGWSGSRFCQAANEMSLLSRDTNTPLSSQREKMSSIYLVDKGSVRLTERVILNQATCAIERHSKKAPTADEQEVVCEVLCLSRGFFIGDIEMVKGSKHYMYSSVAVSSTEVYVFSPEQFALFFMRVPDECATLQALQDMVDRNYQFFSQKVENSCFQSATNLKDLAAFNSQSQNPKMLFRADSARKLNSALSNSFEAQLSTSLGNESQQKKSGIQAYNSKLDEDTMNKEVNSELQKMRTASRLNQSTSIKAIPLSCARGPAHAAVSNLMQNISSSTATSDKAFSERLALQPTLNGQGNGEEWMQSAAAVLSTSQPQGTNSLKPLGLNKTGNECPSPMTARGQPLPQTSRRQNRAETSMSTYDQVCAPARRLNRALTSGNDMPCLTARGTPKTALLKESNSSPQFSNAIQEQLPQMSKQNDLLCVTARGISRQSSFKESTMGSTTLQQDTQKQESYQLLMQKIKEIPLLPRDEKDAGQSLIFQDPVQKKILSARGTPMPNRQQNIKLLTRQQSGCMTSFIEEPLEENEPVEVFKKVLTEAKVRPTIVMTGEAGKANSLLKVEEPEQEVSAEGEASQPSQKEEADDSCILPLNLSPEPLCSTSTQPKLSVVPDLNLQNTANSSSEPVLLFSLTIKVKGKECDLKFNSDQTPVSAAQQFLLDNQLQDDEQKDLYLEAVKSQIGARLKQLRQGENVSLPARTKRTARLTSEFAKSPLLSARAESCTKLGYSKLGEGFLQLKMQRPNSSGVLRTASPANANGLPAVSTIGTK